MAFNTFPQNPFPPNSENAGGGSPYVLPIASDETLGGVKVGNNLTIDANGVLSAPVQQYTTTETDTGRKWIDNKSIYSKVIVLTDAVNVNGNAWLDVDTIDGDTCISVLVLNTSGYCFPFGGGFKDNGTLEILNSRATAVENVKTIICEYTKEESEV